jgi:phosphohistidine phosphatase SixA
MSPTIATTPRRKPGSLVAHASMLLAAVVVLVLPGSRMAHADIPAEQRIADSARLIELLRVPGHIAFMRHAWAPFEGAPKSYPHSAETLGPCETQRNLDEKGREDARRIGRLFNAAGLAFDFIWTSHVCRCVETAELIAGRPVENLPLINSYFMDPDKQRGPAQLHYLRQFLNETMPPGARALMVTHGSLITDLTRIDTDESEIVIVKADGRGGIIVVARGAL